jgi:hypothetical protein
MGHGGGDTDVPRLNVTVDHASAVEKIVDTQNLVPAGATSTIKASSNRE